MTRSILSTLAASATLTLATLASAEVIEVQVRIENLAPENGTLLTPMWIGFHDGAFDLYDLGAPSSMMLERIAEDGNTGPLSQGFLGLGGGDLAGVSEGTIIADTGIPPIAPGESATMTFRINTELATSRYFSYASMVLPSNDAFVANGDAMAHEVVDGDGDFVGAQFMVLGSAVRDAGTEVNDELPMNTAFFGQMAPDTGVDENGVVTTHPGFNAPGTGGILDDPTYANGDFTAKGYQVARITITEVARVRVQLENIAPEFGTAVTPLWVGIHDGSFDTYDGGAPSSVELERIAEDGNTGPLTDLFASLDAGADQTTIVADQGIPVIEAFETATAEFMLDPSDPAARYFSYAAMAVPSNDAFMANGNPTAHPLFDESGAFIGAGFTIFGDEVNDAGTEVNDELPMNTAFFGQMTPDTGVDENGVITAHPGHLPAGSGGIVDDANFVNADFSVRGYEIASVNLELRPAASADLDGNGVVDGGDLGIQLGAWGFNPGNPADLNANGFVDGEDLGLLLGAWGTDG